MNVWIFFVRKIKRVVASRVFKLRRLSGAYAVMYVFVGFVFCNILLNCNNVLNVILMCINLLSDFLWNILDRNFFFVVASTR